MDDGDTLKILHLNINGVRSKVELFQHYLNILKPHVFLLNETKLGAIHDFQIPNFVVFRKDCRPGKWGAAIGVRKDIYAVQNFLPVGDDQVVSVEVVYGNSQFINIVSYYNPPKNM